MCPRNLHGYPHNFGYTETNLNLALVKDRFSSDFIKQLQLININGNFGDFVMNTESLEIIEYFRSNNKNLYVAVSTNGSARTKEFWSQLAIYDPIVHFCLDGLEDTHHLYRQDTQWSKIIANARVFIEAGGRAVWKMIKFDHNAHQIEACELLSKQLGFIKFQLIDEGRNTGNVFDRQGYFSHQLGTPKWFSDTAQSIIENHQFDVLKKSLEEISEFDKTVMPECKVKTHNSGVYISADAKVYPCCWMGFSPDTYKGWAKTLENLQIKQIMQKNDLNKYTFKEAIEWFNLVERSWNINSYSKGRMLTCDKTCGKKKITNVSDQ